MTSAAMRAYDQLIRRSRDRALLESCSTLLEWDEETYMPSGGIAHRSRQRALVAGLHHRALTDPEIGDLIEAIDPEKLGETEAINVREIARLHRRHRRLPQSLVEEIARVSTIAQHAWAGARRARDIEQLRPHLESVLHLKRNEAAALSEGGEAYDALLDEFEPGAKASEIARLFFALKDDVRPLLDAIRGSGKKTEPEILLRHYPVDLQRRFVEEIVHAIGFDLREGRIDTSPHPFCVYVGPGDVRLTARFLDGDFSEGFYSALHEAGHGLYDQGIDPAHWGTPLGEAPSVGLHESQSRLWENFVGRSRGFWTFFFARAQALFRPVLDDVDLDRFFSATNKVAPSAIRARADMVTYDLHILVRFELERQMIAGALEIADLEAAWNDAYERHLGLRPEHAGEGCLQDGHWPSGQFGYFPTYTLGNLIAGQLYRAAKKALGDLEASLAKGDMRPLLDWLRRYVHRRTDLRASAALVAEATGAPLSHHAFVAELRARLEPIYGL